ncbi:hypothetical protein [Xanthomonas bundabergensis]|uniref:hypothetical protein n=1 Tax=Xanthomonas bundabergensis TaxID=3160842 RepID=UPI0035133088
MGVLNVCCYPTKLALHAADHAYIECGGGSYGWGCWGGKSGGTTVRSAHGSTKRADAIGEPDERAGVTHYLINGVCHQSANRILMPALITANGVRGHLLSVSIFGLFGRPSAGFGMFKAPLYTRAGVSGDLDVCLYQGIQTSSQSRAFAERSFIDESVSLAREIYPELVLDTDSILSVSQQTAGEPWSSSEAERAAKFQIESFKLLVRHRAIVTGKRFSLAQYHEMMKIREQFELSREAIEREFVERGQSGWYGFVRNFDELTREFQASLSTILPGQDYEALLDISSDHRMVLSDPDIVESIYGPASRPRGPGSRSP